MKTFFVIALLTVSNLIMTIAWYWHIKPGASHLALWKIVLISWGIAFLEYCFAVPANHFGSVWGIKPFQLKIIQEAITLVVFILFAAFYLKENINFNYIMSFIFILIAVYFAFRK